MLFDSGIVGHDPVVVGDFEGAPAIAVHRVVVPASGPGSIRVVAEVHVCRNCGSLFMDAGNRAKLGGA